MRGASANCPTGDAAGRSADRMPGGEGASADRPSRDVNGAPAAQRREALYRAIERTQAFMHKRVPPDDAMALIRSRFPSPRHFLESNRTTLTQAGLPRLDAFYYAMLPSLARTAMCQTNGVRPRLNRASLMAEYLKALYIGRHDECFYLVLLDNNGRLIRSALLQKGTTDSAPFYLRPVLAAAIQENAKHIVLAHNHPRGTLRPSKEDLACTLRVLNAVTPLRVPMLDHIIIARNRAVSIRETGLIPDILWTAAAPKSKLVREWLDVELLTEEHLK